MTDAADENSGESEAPVPSPDPDDAGSERPEGAFVVPDFVSGASPDLSRPQRQSIWAVIFIVGRLLRRVGIANIGIGLVAVTSGRVPGGLLAGVVAFAVILAAMSILAWWRRTFFIQDGELVTMQGIVNLSRVNIPLGRIQSVNMDQQLLHRVVGLVRARVETAGSASAEFEFDAVDRRVATALRSAVVAAGPIADGVNTVGESLPNGDSLPSQRDPDGRQILRRSIGDLVRVALGRSPLADLAVLAPVLALSFEVFEPPEVMVQELDAPSWLMVIGVIAIAVVAIVAFGFVSTVLRNYDLTLRIEGERLRSTSGLLSTVERSSSLERVQLMSTAQNPVHRRFGMCSVSLSTVSGGVGSADAMRLVGTTPAELADLSAVLFGGPEVPATHAISARAVQRWRLWVGVVPSAVLVAIAAPFVGWWSGVAVLWLAVVVVAAPVVQRRWRFGIGPGEMTVRHGVLTHRATRLSIRKTQAVTVQRNLFHRRYGLATVKIHTAARDVLIPHILESDARAIRDRLLFDVESRSEVWM